MRLSGVQDDAASLIRVGWAVRRLSGGPGPEPALADFLGRNDPEGHDLPNEPFTDRASAWLDFMQAGQRLHPVARAAMGFFLWPLAGLGQVSDRLEAAVTAARVAAGDARGAVFVPLAMGGATGLRAEGSPDRKLAIWLEGVESSALTAMRHLDQIEAWVAKAEAVMAPLSGRTPPLLRGVLAAWPLVSAPMAEKLTGASRAAVQRNLAWMDAEGLIQEVTGQGRFRMWRAAV